MTYAEELQHLRSIDWTRTFFVNPADYQELRKFEDRLEKLRNDGFEVLSDSGVRRGEFYIDGVRYAFDDLLE